MTNILQTVCSQKTVKNDFLKWIFKISSGKLKIVRGHRNTVLNLRKFCADFRRIPDRIAGNFRQALGRPRDKNFISQDFVPLEKAKTQSPYKLELCCKTSGLYFPEQSMYLVYKLLIFRHLLCDVGTKYR